MKKFNVPDMSCGHCTAAIEKAITGIDASAKLNFDLDTKTVDIDSTTNTETLLATLAEEGYPASQVK